MAWEIESTGAVDPDMYSWGSLFSTITNEFFGSFAFWSNQAQLRGISLAFSVGVYEPYDPKCQTGYEPLLHDPDQDDYLWINEILREQDTNPPYYGSSGYARPGGFGANPVTKTNVLAMAEQFNDYVRTQSWPGVTYDGAFFALIAPDSGFAVNFLHGKRSYAYIGGPMVQLTNTNGGWGPSQFHIVMSHETGHIFWACDEYYDPGNPSQGIAPTGCFTCNDCVNYGPRIVGNYNANCANPNIACQFHQACIMDRAESQTLCNVTPYQIGW